MMLNIELVSLKERFNFPLFLIVHCNLEEKTRKMHKIHDQRAIQNQFYTYLVFEPLPTIVPLWRKSSEIV